jgi:Spy/CpxP family protein refolding chaperone
MNLKLRTFPAALALCGLMAIGTATAAGPDSDHMGPHGHFDAEHQLARLNRALDLSDEQSAELLPILQAAEEERQAFHEQVMEQLKPEICAQMQATHDQILTVLTPDQADEFEAMLSERKGRFHDRARRGGMPDFNCDNLDS